MKTSNKDSPVHFDHNKKWFRAIMQLTNKNLPHPQLIIFALRIYPFYTNEDHIMILNHLIFYTLKLLARQMNI